MLIDFYLVFFVHFLLWFQTVNSAVPIHRVSSMHQTFLYVVFVGVRRKSTVFQRQEPTTSTDHG